MADRPKRTLRHPKRFIDEYCAPSPKKPRNLVKDKKFYEIEVKNVDREKKMVQIHYKGYSDTFDEWRPFGSDDDDYFPFVRQERLEEPSEDSLNDRAEYLRGKLYREVKRELFSSKRSDPAVRIEVDCAEDVFSLLFGMESSFDVVMERGKRTCNIPSNRLLNDILGQKWDERVFNKHGDFAYVIEGTVKFWFGKKSSITEYKSIGGRLIKSEIENNRQLVFTFVRGDGNSRQYKERQ